MAVVATGTPPHSQSAVGLQRQRGERRAGVRHLDQLALPLLAGSSHASSTLDDAVLPFPCAWVFGHEGQGVAPALLARCTQILRIPQPGGEESINVAAAAAICLYATRRSGGWR